VKNFLLLLVVGLLAYWWFQREAPSTDSLTDNSRSAVTATARAKTAANPPAVPPQQNPEAERQRRKAFADEYARLSAQREAKEAAYKDAMARYEAQRNAISEQIDALGRVNKNGANNALMDQLTEQRLRLPLPQRP